MVFDEVVWSRARRIVFRLRVLWLRPRLPLQLADAPVAPFVQLWSFVSETWGLLSRAMNHFAQFHESVEKGRVPGYV